MYDNNYMMLNTACIIAGSGSFVRGVEVTLRMKPQRFTQAAQSRPQLLWRASVKIHALHEMSTV
jgi:hypothetical protein